MGGNTSGTTAVFAEARRFLDALLIEPIFSSLYITTPMLDSDQSDFWNAVAAGKWEGTPEGLLERLLMWEAGAGRLRDPLRPKGPRIVDLDLLLFGAEARISDRLTLPHPGLHLRRFALEPLLELDPEITDSRNGRPWQDALQTLTDQGVDRTDRSW